MRLVPSFKPSHWEEWVRVWGEVGVCAILRRCLLVKIARKVFPSCVDSSCICFQSLYLIPKNGFKVAFQTSRIHILRSWLLGEFVKSSKWVPSAWRHPVIMAFPICCTSLEIDEPLTWLQRFTSLLNGLWLHIHQQMNYRLTSQDIGKPT